MLTGTTIGDVITRSGSGYTRLLAVTCGLSLSTSTCSSFSGCMGSAGKSCFGSGVGSCAGGVGDALRDSFMTEGRLRGASTAVFPSTSLLRVVSTGVFVASLRSVFTRAAFLEWSYGKLTNLYTRRCPLT